MYIAKKFKNVLQNFKFFSFFSFLFFFLALQVLYFELELIKIAC